MKQRAILLGLLAALMIGPTALRATWGAEQRWGSALEGVPGLDRPVTYSETKIPLGELVAKVAADTGVFLTAARDVADEPVAVIVKELPARELLEQLAELLDYRWGRRTPGQTGRGGEGETGSPTRDAGRPFGLNAQHSTLNARASGAPRDLPGRGRQAA